MSLFRLSLSRVRQCFGSSSKDATFSMFYPCVPASAAKVNHVRQTGGIRGVCGNTFAQMFYDW